MSLKKDRITGQDLAPLFKSRGWKRDIPNNWFHKEDKFFFISGNLLVFGFETKVNIKTYHHLKIAAVDTYQAERTAE
jgi:hypothetical protein